MTPEPTPIKQYKSNVTNSLVNLTSTTSDCNPSPDSLLKDMIESEGKSKNTFKYNNSTRTPIIQRSKNNLKKKKSQKLARRLNRNK
jgi:hypothetical protein